MDDFGFLLILILAVGLSMAKKWMEAKEAEKKHANKNYQSGQEHSRLQQAAEHLQKSANQAATRLQQAKAPEKNTTTQAVRARAAEKATTTIVERAKSNTSRLAEDETLRQIERAHGHEEKHPEASVEHSRNCQTLGSDNTELTAESIFGSTEDLMVMGYSGKLSFDRDFIAEGMDMLASISDPESAMHAVKE